MREVWLIVDDAGDVVVNRVFSSLGSAQRCCLLGERAVGYVPRELTPAEQIEALRALEALAGLSDLHVTNGEAEEVKSTLTRGAL